LVGCQEWCRGEERSEIFSSGWLAAGAEQCLLKRQVHVWFVFFDRAMATARQQILHWIVLALLA
jgi:hypothetical protein